MNLVYVKFVGRNHKISHCVHVSNCVPVIIVSCRICGHGFHLPSYRVVRSSADILMPSDWKLDVNVS
jgi:hypothetical protein